MAQISKRVDDIDGKELPEDARPIEFSVNGTSYAIDLSERNARQLERALKPFVEAATVTGRSRRAARPTTRTTRTTRNGKAAAVRAWAAEQGIEVGPMGRVPIEVVALYDKAHRKR